jgi:hypothetical protein
MPPKGLTQRKRTQRSRARAGPNNVPTVVADPKFALTLHCVDESAEGLPFVGDLTYGYLMAAAARQMHSHLPTPFVLPEGDEVEWTKKFLGPFHWIQIQHADAWGNPYVNTDSGTSTRFEFSLHPNDTNALPPRPARIDSAAGSSDRPYAHQQGGPMYFADESNRTQRCAHLTSCDIAHFHVRIW